MSANSRDERGCLYSEKLECANIVVNPFSRDVLRDGQLICFTTMEFDVLYFLASNPNIAFTKEQIYEAVIQDTYAESAYVIRDVIYRIRRKTGLQNIERIYGYGYRFQRNSV